MDSGMKSAGIVVAAGRGARVGGAIPKQYRLLAGKPLFLHSVERLMSSGLIEECIVVVPIGDEARVTELLSSIDNCRPVPGGADRQSSVLAGLEALVSSAPDFVFIHDAARPCLSSELISRLEDALTVGGGAMPGLQVTDTLRRVDEKICGDTISREGIWRVQTPQSFCYKSILSAHRAAAPGHTDDVSIATSAGMPVSAVPGDPDNIKVTEPEDFQRIEAIMTGKSTSETRTGQGFDVHRFGPGDHVWLCGVKIDHGQGLIGHSDADVGLHALTDALLGAVGDGDIGQHFPPTDPQWRGASSDRFLAHAGSLIKAKGASIMNVDVTLIAEAPKVGPHRQTMVSRVAEILSLDSSRVSVKATTTERLGFTGRGEGIAAQAIATIRLDRT